MDEVLQGNPLARTMRSLVLNPVPEEDIRAAGSSGASFTQPNPDLAGAVCLEDAKPLEKPSSPIVGTRDFGSPSATNTLPKSRFSELSEEPSKGEALQEVCTCRKLEKSHPSRSDVPPKKVFICTYVGAQGRYRLHSFDSFIEVHREFIVVPIFSAVVYDCFLHVLAAASCAIDMHS